MLILDYPQGSSEWLQARIGVATASRFSDIISATGKPSASAIKYACELAAEYLTGEHCKPYFENDAMRRGKELEVDARRMFEFSSGLTVQEVSLCMSNEFHDELFVGASPDGLIKQDAEYIAGVEIKCLLPHNHALAVVKDEIPSEHLPQIHGGMAVTGIKKWYFVAYCPGIKPMIKEVEWNDYTEKLKEGLTEFMKLYQECINKLSITQE